ncbi:MAG: N-6 DNA methylase [Nanoarchaeota archaeon]|nr:N-6 DNA methylase [Nanoarchaeota archaeon]
MDKEKAKERVKQLVKEFSEFSKEDLDKKSEIQIQYEFIDELFKALGWDMRKDVEREERVLKGRADYIFRIGNQESLVVEAKKTGVPLLEEQGRQAVSYAYHRKIKFSVLTNFKYIRVYHALSNIRNIDKNLLFWLEFKDFEKEFDKLWVLSRESFETKEINKLLSKKDEQKYKPIDESILADLLLYREWLSKDLKSKRMQLGDSQIDEVVQILIDRLIFMRSAEDRGLEEKDFLLKIVQNYEQGRIAKRLWEVLKIQFKIFDKMYNSKLFMEGLLEKEGFFDERTLIKVIRGLYYGTQHQQERYMFDEIPGDLLGNIYEQYLGTILRGTEKRVKLDSESGKRKKMGIYYTPSYIVDYIVKNTVREYVKDKTIDEILEVRILDPACGSGSFLIRAFQEVCNIVEEKLKKGEKSKKWNTFQVFKERLNLSQKSKILKNCIYGVDLDEKAVELAQLNLMLKLLEEETRETRDRILPLMRHNIKCGNSLIDDSKVAGDKAFNWKAQFPEVFTDGGFDVVVGNPPWSSKIVSNEINSFLSKKFSIPQKNMNIFGVFVIHSLRLLKKEGIFGLLIPKVIIKNDSYTSIRKEIIENYSLFKIMDFGQFPGVASDAICLLIKNKREFHPITIQFFEESKLCNENKIEEDIFSKSDSFVFSLSTDDKIQKILDKIVKDSKKLSELFNVKRGIELGQKSLVVQCTKCGYYNEANTKYYGQDDKKCKKCKSKLVINDKSSKIISSDKNDKDYDSEAIAGNQLGRYCISNKYYILSKLKGIDYKEKAFEGPRILIKRINTKIDGTFIKSKLFAFNTVYSIYGNQAENNYLSCLAVLNSKLMKFYYEFSYNVGMNLTTQVTIDFLSKIPIHLPTSKTQEQKIVGLVDRMLKLQKKVHDGKIAGREKEMLEQQIKQTDYEIDEEVYKLYGITDEERKVIEESLK